jgi:hypothetical protein
MSERRQVSKKRQSTIGFLRQILLPGILLSASACSSQQNVNFSVIQESKQCGELSAKIARISSVQDKAQIIKKLNRFSDDKKQEHLLKLLEQHAINEQLFLLSQGQKSSAGYGFNVTAKTGSIIDKTLTLPITFTYPEPGSMQAQVMTSPCLILGIDSKVQFEHIVIDNLEFTISN